MAGLPGDAHRRGRQHTLQFVASNDHDEVAMSRIQPQPDAGELLREIEQASTLCKVS